MLEYSVNEMQEAIGAAKNINAALKKVLKNEPNMPGKSSRFLKDFRIACGAKDPARKMEYLNNKLPDYEAEIFAVARYAYIEPVNAIASEITEVYADKFNTTYSQGDQGVTVKDQAAFDKIVKEVMVKVEEGLKKNALPVSGFMKNVLLQHIFDAEVLKEVLRTLD